MSMGDKSIDELLVVINNLMISNQVLTDKVKELQSSGPNQAMSWSSRSNSTVQSNLSLLDQSKFEITGQVTDVGGKLYQVVKSNRGTPYSLRQDGSRVILSASQLLRMRPDPRV